MGQRPQAFLFYGIKLEQADFPAAAKDLEDDADVLLDTVLGTLGLPYMERLEARKKLDPIGARFLGYDRDVLALTAYTAFASDWETMEITDMPWERDDFFARDERLRDFAKKLGIADADHLHIRWYLNTDFR